MKACPFCRGRATKLVSLSSGVITCQQCGKSYTPAVTPAKEQSKDSSVAGMLDDLLFQVRGLTNCRTDCGRMHLAVGVEALIADIRKRITQASDAVARPASSKQGLSIRVGKRRDQTGGLSSRPHAR